MGFSLPALDCFMATGSHVMFHWVALCMTPHLFSHAWCSWFYDMVASLMRNIFTCMTLLIYNMASVMRNIFTCIALLIYNMASVMRNIFTNMTFLILQDGISDEKYFQRMSPLFYNMLSTYLPLFTKALESYVNSSPPGQNDRHFTDDIFRWIFVNEKSCILIKISLKFVPNDPIMLTRFIDAYMRH